MMNTRFSIWSSKRIMRRLRCTVEKSFRCIPLEDDEICARCFGADGGGAAAVEKEKGRRGPKGNFFSNQKRRVF